MKDYLNFWKRYTDFKGCSTVSEFSNAWMWLIISGFLITVTSCIVLISCFHMNAQSASDLLEIFLSIFSLVSLSPCLAITVRRLRDAGYSPKSFLWLLLPVIGFFAFFARLFSRSTHSTDGY